MTYIENTMLSLSSGGRGLARQGGIERTASPEGNSAQYG